MPTFATQPVDETFFDTAPVRLRAVFDIAKPAADVWDDLTADNPLSWCRVLTRIEWTSPRPFGVGTTRTAVSLGGTSVIHERYFRWEEGRRQSFHAIDASAPLWRRFAEDYLVEPASDTACRFAWMIAYEPQPAARLGDPINRRILSSLFRDTRRHYQ